MIFFFLVVPVAPEGPGGIFICCENFLVYRNLVHPTEKYVPYPIRKTPHNGRTIMINTYGAFMKKVDLTKRLY